MALQEEEGILLLWQQSALLQGVGQSRGGLPKLRSELKHPPQTAQQDVEEVIPGELWPTVSELSQKTNVYLA